MVYEAKLQGFPNFRIIILLPQTIPHSCVTRWAIQRYTALFSVRKWIIAISIWEPLWFMKCTHFQSDCNINLLYIFWHPLNFSFFFNFHWKSTSFRVLTQYLFVNRNERWHKAFIQRLINELSAILFHLKK